MVRKLTLFAIATALVVVLAACGVSGNGGDGDEPADITDKALALDDLPTGWAEDNSDDDSDSPALDCMEDAERAVQDPVGSAEVSYVQGSAVPQLRQLLAEFERPEAASAAVDALDRAYDGCGEFEFESDGDTVKGQIGKVSLPDVAGADDQVSYQLTAESEGFGLAAGILVASRGRYVTMLVLLDIGSFDADQLVELGELALGKLGSASGSKPSRDSTTTEPREETTTTEATTDPATAPSLVVEGTVTVPDGEEGELSVVLTGEADGDSGTVPVVVRNRTPDTLYGLEVTGTARSDDGDLAGSGSSQGFTPAVVGPGEWAFGYVYFEGAVPAGATFDLTAEGETEDDSIFGLVDATISEHNVVEDDFGTTVVGIVANETGEEIAGPVNVNLMCFDEAGTGPLSTHDSYTEPDTIPSDGTA
jgi:hypothetical protein